MSLRSKFSALTFNEKVTACVALASLITSIAAGVLGTLLGWWSYNVSADSTDMKIAIGKLSTLAGQSQAQTAALYRQNSIIVAQLQTQQQQASYLADQSATARSHLAKISEELDLSRKQFELSAKSFKSAEKQFSMMSVDLRQKYRGITIVIPELNLPSRLGSNYKATVIVTNVSPYPITISREFWGVAVTQDLPEQYFKDRLSEEYKSPRSGPTESVTIASGNSHRWSVTMTAPVSELMLYAIRENKFNVVAYAAVEYKDPFGDFHHDYVCRFSNASSTNNICGTPEAD